MYICMYVCMNVSKSCAVASNPTTIASVEKSEE